MCGCVLATSATPLHPNPLSPTLISSGGRVFDSRKKKEVDQLARMRVVWWFGYRLLNQSSFVSVLIECPAKPS